MLAVHSSMSLQPVKCNVVIINLMVKYLANCKTNTGTRQFKNAFTSSKMMIRIKILQKLYLLKSNFDRVMKVKFLKT